MYICIWWLVDIFWAGGSVCVCSVNGSRQGRVCLHARHPVRFGFLVEFWYDKTHPTTHKPNPMLTPSPKQNTPTKNSPNPPPPKDTNTHTHTHLHTHIHTLTHQTKPGPPARSATCSRRCGRRRPTPSASCPSSRPSPTPPPWPRACTSTRPRISSAVRKGALGLDLICVLNRVCLSVGGLVWACAQAALHQR